MASTSLAEVKCTKCKKVYETDVVDHVDLSEDRDLIKALKAGKANRVQCPKCKKVMYLKRSIVVNFEPENRIIVFDPKARTKAAKEDLMQDYQAVISFNETLSEIAEETEFQVISQLSKLKTMLDAYLEAHK
ncbi:MAG: CpXC domain-containing protein [Candidatus Thorarchaeota archaeon]